MSQLATLLKVVAVAGTLALLPLTVSSSGRVVANDAYCDGGTCCPEYGSLCYPNGCSSSECMQPNRYWRSDGKRCSAPAT